MTDTTKEQPISESTTPTHEHNWRHMGGAAFGMYRCDVDKDGCLAFGYSKIYRGVCKNQKIVPYSCAKCGAWAVGHDHIPPKMNKYKIYPTLRGRKEWRGKNHRGPLDQPSQPFS